MDLLEYSYRIICHWSRLHLPFFDRLVMRGITAVGFFLKIDIYTPSVDLFTPFVQCYTLIIIGLRESAQIYCLIEIILFNLSRNPLPR